MTNSALTQAMILQLQPDLAATASDIDRLTLSCQPFLEKNIQSLINCMDDLINEQQKVSAGSEGVSRHRYLCCVRTMREERPQVARPWSC